MPGGSELVLIYLIQSGDYPLWLPLAVATAGNALGGLVTWGMGWWVARRWPLRDLSPRQQRARVWMQRHGYPVLLLSWLPLVGDPLCFISGWLKMRLLPAALLILAGKAGRYALLVAGVQGVVG
nr:DedA family protein [Motiliproteus sediminis]